MIEDLTMKWRRKLPEIGDVVTWFAMDNRGQIAIMVNNRFGDIPDCLSNLPNIVNLLDELNEYNYEESKKYKNYPPDKHGGFIVDFFSPWIVHCLDKNQVINDLEKDLKRPHKNRVCSEANWCVNKGLYVFMAVEGNVEGEDYPVGYEGFSKMGDYFRYLIPTIKATIEDFPKPLRKIIAISDTLDFSTLQLLDNYTINDHFKRLYFE